MKKVFFGAAALCAASALVASPALAQVQLQFRNTVDLVGQFAAGTSPAAVAWNGTDAFVSAFNNTAVAVDTGIVRVNNALTASPSFSTFGAISTPAFTGVNSLALSGNTLAAALDTSSQNGLRAFDVSNRNTTPANPIWTLGTISTPQSQRGSGVAFDPGFNGQNSGFTLVSTGGGIARPFAVSNGTPGQNYFINANPVSTLFRDVTFNPANGNIYLRENNRILQGTRTAGNSINNGGVTTPFGNLGTGNAVLQNIGFVNALSGNFLIVNNRPNANNQAFTDAIRAFDLSGNALTINFNGFTALNGTGAYDFSFDATSQTLAISDFSNQKLYIFGVGAPNAAPEPGTFCLALIGCVGLFAARRRRK